MQTEAEIIDILKGEFTVQVKNFKKYNPGSTKQFIRLENDWFQDLYVRDWPVDTRYVYVFLLSLIGRNDGGPCLCDVRKLSLNCHYRADRLSKALVRLWKDEFIFIEKKRKEEIREEETALKKEAKELEEKSVENQPLPTKKEEENSSSPRAGEALFLFEEIPKQILKQYEVSSLGIETWVRKWGIEKVSASLVPIAHKFEITANHKNPYYRKNFTVFFENWMTNNEARSKGAGKLKEARKTQEAEEKQWNAY